MLVAKKVVTEDAITFNWADEESTTVKLADLPEAMVQRAALHGLGQKLGDTYSGVNGNLVEAKELFNAALDALVLGDWNRKGGATGSGLWVEAIARAAGVDIEKALEAWNKMDDKTKAATKKHPDVDVAYKELQLERKKAAAKAADAPSLSL